MFLNFLCSRQAQIFLETGSAHARPAHPAQQSKNPLESGNFHSKTYFLSKNINYFVKHYTIDSSLDSSVVEVQDSFLLKKKVVTGASLSPLDQHLALVSYQFKRFLGFIPISSAAFFISEEGTFWETKKFRKKKIITLPFARQWEAITWLNEKEVLIATEANGPFRAQIRRLKID